MADLFAAPTRNTFAISLSGRSAGAYRSLQMAMIGRFSGPGPFFFFHTSECRGGVERRQLELKGVEGGD